MGTSMKKISILTSLLLTTSLQTLANESCHSEWQSGADYDYTVQHDDVTRHSTWALIRQRQKFLSINGYDNTTQGWEVGANGQVKMTQWFDADQRGIEYQPEDLESRFAQEQYKSRFSLVAPEWIQSLPITNTIEHSPCERMTSRKGNIAGYEIAVEWLENAKLPYRLTLSKEGVIESWSAKQPIQNSSRYQEEIAKRESYFTIDKADIGDQESDPFFTGMKTAMQEGQHDH